MSEQHAAAGVLRLLDSGDEPLSVDEVLAAVADPAAGGTTLFVGSVRDHDSDREVTELGYEAHPEALTRLREVADRVAADPTVIALAAVHRSGNLKVGDIAVVVAVAAAHRDAAFVASRKLIDELKADVPIWKHQSFADGTSEWVGSA
jgi:molybdopterin synthase catalytic subunit